MCYNASDFRNARLERLERQPKLHSLLVKLMAVAQAVAQAQAAAVRRGGRDLSSLFDEDNGPMKRRKTADAAGTEHNAPGAICFFCGKPCKKSSELAWLYHLVGKDGDKGCGWAVCAEAKAKLPSSEYDKLREMFTASQRIYQHMCMICTQ